MSSNPVIPLPANARRLRIAARVGAAVLGGYVFAWGVVAAVTSALFAVGVEFHDAEFMGGLSGLLAYLVVFLWAFAASRLAVVWLVLLGGGALLAAAASLLQSWLV
jgi:hypothetical protein